MSLARRCRGLVSAFVFFGLATWTGSLAAASTGDEPSLSLTSEIKGFEGLPASSIPVKVLLANGVIDKDTLGPGGVERAIAADETIKGAILRGLVSPSHAKTLVHLGLID